ncbi:MAG: dTDP-4-dehydrorhamnose 3,5-epimerase [Acidobacteriaceae bacterium]|nr:dTDP-4-dehydrorhamnose 3,5-epimerase [Acidobacteriaceae bacterium]
MRIVPTELPGVILIEPVVHRDARGFFLESYHLERYRAAGIAGPFVQDNRSHSVRGTIRGLHLQVGQHAQGKLVRIVQGEIFDVAVDVRRGSPTFGRWVGMALGADSFCQCYIPPGFAHGFAVLSDTAEVEYKCTAPYDPASEIGIAWNDPALAIAWPIDTPILSARDEHHPPLTALSDRLPVYSSTAR